MSLIDQNDTICAISTPIGEGGISIVRLSGDRALGIADAVFEARSKKKLAQAAPLTIHYGHIVHKKEIIDEVLVGVHRAPHSYTAEDIVEINTHGGVVLTRRILDMLIAEGARLAEPGEFTKRAFLNGRIDLTQAEAVLDIIKAKTDLSAQAALQHLQGFFSQEVGQVKSRLITLLAHVETFVDFPEEDAEIFSNIEFEREFHELENIVQHMIETYKNGELIREGVHTVLVGKTNVGKSSLLNTLLNRDRAIVSKYPGTTRDALEELIEIDGILFRLVDTAGIIPSPQHELDYLSIEKTRQHCEKGDLIIFVLDGSRPLDEEDEDIYNKISDKSCIIVVNKNDLKQRIDKKRLHAWSKDNRKVIAASVVTKTGIAHLEKALSDFVWQGKHTQQKIFITRVRHKKALEKSLRYIQNARMLFKEKKSIELIAYDVRDALAALRELVGEVYTEEILNVIFSEFCVGK